MLLDLTVPCTQGTFAGLVGTVQPVVSGLVAAGVLREGGSSGEWLAQYAGHLRALVAGRGGAMLEERLLLLRAKRRAAELEHDTREGRLLDAEEIRRLAAHAAGVLAAEFDHWPRRLAPRLLGLDNVAAIAALLDTEQRELRIRAAEEMRRYVARTGHGEPLATGALSPIPVPDELASNG